MTRVCLPAVGLMAIGCLVALPACTLDEPSPRIDFSDYQPWNPDLFPGDDDGGLWTDESGLDARGMLDGEGKPDTTKPAQCIPNVAYCHLGKLVQCNNQGNGIKVLDNCSDDNECTADGCFDGACTHEQVSGSCCHPECGVGELCLSGQCICAANCFGKDCGDDGCGGSCGDCPEDSKCSLQGKCDCTPVCGENECGDDGCGGSCGYCVEPNECLDGQCQCNPSCLNKVCGDDGCGGSCGDCPVLNTCKEGVCSFYCPMCPDIANCDMIAFSGHTYNFCKFEKSWSGASDVCEEHKAHLATVSSVEENAFLHANLGGANSWIGYYQEWYSWDWKWVNGEAGVFEYWDSNQPDNGGWFEEEDCTELRTSSKWNDEQCGTKHWFICEFEP